MIQETAPLPTVENLTEAAFANLRAQLERWLSDHGLPYTINSIGFGFTLRGERFALEVPLGDEWSERLKERNRVWPELENHLRRMLEPQVRRALAQLERGA